MSPALPTPRASKRSALPGVASTGERQDDFEKLIAISHVKRAAEEGVTRAKLEEMREGIERDVSKFRELLESRPQEAGCIHRLVAAANA